MAGLLARPVFDAFPSRYLGTVAKEFQKHLLDLQLRVQLPIYTGFPISYRQMKFSDNNRNRFAILRVLNQFC
jgi:hypothetical protein